MTVLSSNEIQLRLIKEIVGNCESRGVRVWLLGGWGIDALKGVISREHYDSDMIAKLSSRPRLREIIKHISGRIVEDTPQKLRFKKNGVQVDIIFYEEYPDGTLVSELEQDDAYVYPWPPESFPGRCNGRLPGLVCRAISWEAQYVAKAGYSHYQQDTTLRDKDVSDLATICEHLATDQQEKLKRYFPGIPRASMNATSDNSS